MNQNIKLDPEPQKSQVFEFVSHESFLVVLAFGAVYGRFLLAREIFRMDAQASGDRQLAKDVSKLYQSGLLSDFVIITSDGQEYPVHRTILTARSEVFLRMFCTENSKEMLTGRCEVADVDGETMRMLLAYVYRITTSETKEPAKDRARSFCRSMKFLVAADKYAMLDAVAVGVVVLRLRLLLGQSSGPAKLREATDVLLLAERYNLPELRKAALKRIARIQKEFLQAGLLEVVRERCVELVEVVLHSVVNVEGSGVSLLYSG